MTIAYAIAGAILGALLVTVTGLRFHIGSWFFDGPAGMIGAACAGALIVLLVRYFVRLQYGPIIP